MILFDIKLLLNSISHTILSKALGEVNSAMNREAQQGYYQEDRQRTIQASMYERSRLITNLIGRRR